MPPESYILIGLLLIAMYLSVRFQKLTVTAALTGGLISLLIYFNCGYYPLIFMGAFFILGSAATSWKIKRKQAFGLAEKNKGMRTATQVFANAGVAAILGIFAYFHLLEKDILNLMIACSFSSATADTLSSELGNIYGSNYYNIASFKKDIRGLNGVVSLEGTLLGIAGSTIIALLYIIEATFTFKNVSIIIIAGIFGNLTDSFLGATLERKKIIGNNAVNFLNTLAGSITGYLLYILL